MKITYWSDFACPYCYIGEVRLDKAIAKLQSQNELTDSVEIELKAFQLDPNAPLTSSGPTQERFAKKYGISHEQAGEQLQKISQLATEEGIGFDYADTLFTNTMDAHRLTKYAQQNVPELADKLKKAIYKAYFIDQKELANREVLTAIAKNIGLDKDVTALLDSDQFREEVIADQDEAMRLGVRGVPYFVINDTYAIPGAMSQQDFENALRQIYNE
ncbi:DsbA family oxidoreductase [Psychrobacter phenylpyruvicus]|uniref:Protein-disulfide isomerase n=2 Tax=Psychrobacter phenylpyruvicus TaxID=29432 RepID=A0A379LJR2_9GAMM|nr:DsbA family oxidoreductase [Psychrobacter phenylpyruvicus]SUD90849.1 Protein-disulfide isomerase [Psychrobacter phenylpyruvicus]